MGSILPFVQRCAAIVRYPYLSDWTDEADEWHLAGEERPLFGQLAFACSRPIRHDGKHNWPDPQTITVPPPDRQWEAGFIS